MSSFPSDERGTERKEMGQTTAEPSSLEEGKTVSPTTSTTDEKSPPPAYPDVDRSDSIVAAEIHRTIQIQSSIGVLRVLRRAEEWIDSKVGIELRGIDRIPEEEKQPPSQWNIFLLWWSLNVHVGVLPLGVLGPAFGLSLKASIAASVLGTALGALCTAFTGTLGPKVRFWDDCRCRRVKRTNFFSLRLACDKSRVLGIRKSSLPHLQHIPLMNCH